MANYQHEIDVTAKTTNATSGVVDSGKLIPTTNATNGVVDTKSPFYMQPLDNPGMIFVTQPLDENGTNYFTWRRAFTIALVSKNKVGFVDGTIVQPDINSINFLAWLQCDALVKSWLINSLSKELQNDASHSETTREIWKDLEDRFTQGIAPRIYELKRNIALLHQSKASISSYYGTLKSLWNEMHALRPTPICSCGGCNCGLGRKVQALREEEKVFDFLMGLDEQFTTVRSQILSQDPLPGIGRAYAVAAQEEKQRAVAATHTPSIEASVFMAKGINERRRYTGDNNRNDQPRRRLDETKLTHFCTHCGKTGHEKDHCYVLYGYPAHWNKSGKGNGGGSGGGPNGGRGRGFGSTTRALAVSQIREDNHYNPNMQDMANVGQKQNMAYSGLNAGQAHNGGENNNLMDQLANQALQLTPLQRAHLLDLLSTSTSSVNAAAVQASGSSTNNFSGLIVEDADWNG